MINERYIILLLWLFIKANIVVSIVRGELSPLKMNQNLCKEKDPQGRDCPGTISWPGPSFPPTTSSNSQRPFSFHPDRTRSPWYPVTTRKSSAPASTADRMALSISGTPSSGTRGLLSPRWSNLLPFPAAMIRQFILPFSISAVDESFGHAIDLVIRILAWGVFAEVGRWGGG